MEAVTEVARRKLAEGVFEGILEMVPRAWLMPVGRVEAEAGETVAMRRSAYVDLLRRRLGQAEVFVEEAQRVRSELV